MRKTLFTLLAIATIFFGYKILPVKAAEGTCQCNVDFQIKDASKDETCKGTLVLDWKETFDAITNKINNACAVTDNVPDSGLSSILVGDVVNILESCGKDTRQEAGQFAYSVVCGDTNTIQSNIAPTTNGTSTGASIETLQGQARSLNKANLSNPAQLVGRFINILLAFIGSISLVLYIYAGILWMTASGSSERVDMAKKILVWTTLGVVVMLSSYMLAGFLFKSLGL